MEKCCHPVPTEAQHCDDRNSVLVDLRCCLLRKPSSRNNIYLMTSFSSMKNMTEILVSAFLLQRGLRTRWKAEAGIPQASLDATSIQPPTTPLCQELNGSSWLNIGMRSTQDSHFAYLQHERGQLPCE